jgi:uncharacterized membrane protein
MAMWFVERRNCVVKVGQPTKCLTSRVWPREWEFQVFPFTVTCTMVSTAYLTVCLARRNGTKTAGAWMASLRLLLQWNRRRNLAYVLYDDGKSHTNTLKNYVLVLNGWSMKVAEKAILFHRVFWLDPKKEDMQIGLPSNFTLQCPQYWQELHLSLKCEQN